MADLLFEADFNDLQLLRRELLGVSKDAQKSAAVFDREYRKVERQLNKTAQANQKFVNETLKVDRAAKSASASANVFEKELRKQESTVERLSVKYKPLYAASKQYERSLDEINEATRLGVLNARQQEIAIDNLNREFQEFVRGTAGWSNQFVDGSNLAGRSANRMGMVAQQAGFQVGDFIVQVQSGANPLVAFSQQATQLVGILGFMNPALIGVGAALGILIPLGTALASMWMNTSQSAKEATTAVGEFKRAVDEAPSSIAKMEAELFALRNGFEDVTEAGFVLQIREAEKALKDAQLALASGPQVGARVLASEKEISAAEELVSTLKEQLEQYRKIVAERRSDETTKKLLEDEKQYQEFLNRRFQTFEDQRQSLQEQVALSAAILQFGRESESVKRLEAQQEERKFEAQLRATNLTEQQIQTLLEVFRTQQNLTREIENSENAAKGLANGMDRVAEKATAAARAVLGIFNALRATMRTIEAQEAGVAAAQRVIGRGGSEIQARSAQAGAEVEAQMRAQGATEAEIAGAVSMAVQNERRRLENQAREEAAFGIFNPSRSGGGGSTRQQITQEQFLDNLRKEIEIKRRLIGLGENEREIQERVIDLQQRAERLGLKIGQDTLERLAREEQMIERLRQAQETYTGIVQNSLDTLLDGATSVEDAFISMIRNILKELAQEHITGPISEGIGGFLGKIFGSANGNVFSGGSVKAFANGGVVSGATLFPMRGNTTGLMGEAGPEAIMPLKRGPNGRLGVEVTGGNNQPVNITQVFQFSANGDESVKQIIRKEAPAIAKMTENQILNQRRRGGVFKKTFGG